MTLPPETPYVEVITPGEVCGADEAIVGPDGLSTLLVSNAAVRLGGRRLNVAQAVQIDKGCFGGSAGVCAPLRFRSIAGVASAQWAVGGGALIVYGDRLTRPSGVALFEANATGRLPELVWRGQFKPLAASVNLDGYVRGGIETLPQLIDQAARPSLNGERVRSVSIRWDGSWTRLVEDPADLSLTLYDADGDRDGDPAEPAIAPGQGSKFFSAILEDAASGDPVGSIFGRRIYSRGRDLDRRRLERAWLSFPQYYPKSVSYSAAHRGSVSLMQSAYGGMFLMSVDRGGKVSRTSTFCDGGVGQALLPSVTPLVWGEKGREVPVWLYHRPHNRRLLLYFHGGPGEAAAGKPLSGPAREFLVRGYDVAIVEYSGTRGLGSELAERLARDGVAAIQHDLRGISAAIDALGRYREFAVYGESYGAVYALSPIIQERVGLTLLVAPWIDYRDPAIWAHPKLSMTQVAYQKRRERLVFGWGEAERPTPEYEAMLKTLALTKRPGQTALLVLSEADDISPASLVSERLRVNATGDEGFRYVLLPNVPHAAMRENVRTRSEIASFLDRAAGDL